MAVADGSAPPAYLWCKDWSGVDTLQSIEFMMNVEQTTRSIITGAELARALLNNIDDSELWMQVGWQKTDLAALSFRRFFI